MFTKGYKVYGREGRRQRESFNESWAADWSDGQGIRKIALINSDRTGTNDYAIVIISRDTAEECELELEGQLSDGVFECCRCGYVEKITGWMSDPDIRELAGNLDWGNPFEDPDDMKDSLRTNWETPLLPDDVESVYREMCRLWEEKHGES